MNSSPIVADIKNRKLKPLYLLHGEESYFIDLISKALEDHVLSEAEKGFNLTVLYGKETEFSQLISAAKRYPMMAEYQVIIVKEAQHLKWKSDDSLLQKYVDNPTPTTILVFAYKYAKFDKRKKIFKSFEKNGLVLESPKLYDDKVAAWIIGYIKDAKHSIHPQAAALMGEYLGTDLSKVANELDKLMLNIPATREIAVADIEQNIGISKDYTIFELNAALAKRQSAKVYQIVDYFAANPKAHPLVVVIGGLSAYFIKVLKYHYLADKSSAAVAKELGVHPFFTKEYELAARNYNRRKTFDIIHFLKETDLQSKGMNIGYSAEPVDLLRELMFKIMN
ncbi:DNA polymerase III subunit delta [Sphingobacteriaceae bacterium WQ 2009]|uniref:DNA polymerase III subunit delta n=1 Tax=Rhinopithecimicrobium faecis TaxID=2820698 RepID=A0A8T4HA94_9SPHI|nr:DNA polymerase III subunit delta [Sphingobacteriaceae bacterium WQ 2009]